MDKAAQFKQECIDLYSELHLDALLNKIADKICDYLQCEVSSIFLYDSSKEELYFEIATGDNAEELKKIVMKKGEGIVGWVAETLQSTIVNDCKNDPRFTAITDKKTSFVTSSLIAIPVINGSHFLGVLEAVNKINGIFDDDNLHLLQSIASFISIPLQNAMLFRKITAEINEKAQLIELGKIISHSSNLEEVFNSLKTIITHIINPLEISVTVISENKTYHLIANQTTPHLHTQPDGNFSNPKNHHTHFPLTVKDHTVGLMEIVPRRKIPDETISLIKGIAIFAAISIEKYEMYARMIEKERLEKELEVARKIQQQFLPAENIRIKGIDVASVNVASSRVGGDYYDIIKLNENHTIFTINDIAGHGIPGSLLMAIFSANFKYRIHKDLDILAKINFLNNLIAETTGHEQYVTSLTCLIHTDEMYMQYINAGHLPPVLFRKNEFIELTDGELVLGMFPDMERTIHHVRLEKDDILVLYTDGLAEAENKKQEQFGIERLKDFIRKNKDLNARIIKDNLILELQRFTGEDVFTDDVTFIIMKIG